MHIGENVGYTKFAVKAERVVAIAMNADALGTDIVIVTDHVGPTLNVGAIEGDGRVTYIVQVVVRGSVGLNNRVHGRLGNKTLETLIPLCSNDPLRALWPLVALVALATQRTLPPLVALEALTALGALPAKAALTPRVTFIALIALEALTPLGSLDARNSLPALGTLIPLRSLPASQSLGALPPLPALEALAALGALWAGVSLVALVALTPLGAYRPLCTLCTRGALRARATLRTRDQTGRGVGGQSAADGRQPRVQDRGRNHVVVDEVKYHLGNANFVDQRAQAGFVVAALRTQPQGVAGAGSLGQRQRQLDGGLDDRAGHGGPAGVVGNLDVSPTVGKRDSATLDADFASGRVERHVQHVDDRDGAVAVDDRQRRH